MKDYTIKISTVIPFTARNQAQANERGEKVSDQLRVDPKWHPTWLGDMEIPEYTVEEV